VHIRSFFWGNLAGVTGFDLDERTTFHMPLVPDISISLLGLQLLLVFPVRFLISKTLPPKCITALRFDPGNLLITNIVVPWRNHLILNSLAEAKVLDRPDYCLLEEALFSFKDTSLVSLKL
jgi:hypothetical protein